MRWIWRCLPSCSVIPSQVCLLSPGNSSTSAGIVVVPSSSVIPSRSACSCSRVIRAWTFT
ncbi:MAG TPA: hypothetical protein VLM79_40185 [Kofleriaceae bacterium]|nr:hypothetical protein [Kofleriaceae bacterium]